MLSLVPYNGHENHVFRHFDNMERNFFSQLPSTKQFRTDISEKDGTYFLQAELPGFSKEDIKVDISSNVLTISAKQEQTENSENENFIRRERRFGSFSRSFSTEGIDIENISASYKDGVLSLSLPKSKELTAKSIEISD